MTEPNIYVKTFLAPGEYAILHTGYSPIANKATSFHTNRCVGYISEFTDFNPRLRSKCLPPNEILTATPENIKSYGYRCVEFFNQEAWECTTYTNKMPARLLPQCKELVADKLTYHSCLKDSLEKIGFNTFNNGGWYLYLGLDAELWRNNYEAIQLLDAEGKVVDVFRY